MSRRSHLISYAVHAVVIALLLLVSTHAPRLTPPQESIRLIYVRPFRSHAPGGGGGTRQPDPPLKGMLPPPSRRVFVPPMIPVSDHPLLPLRITMDAPPEVALNPANEIGDPRGTGFVLSGGPGGPFGIGTGGGAGIGPGNGSKYGTGEDGVYWPGHGVTMPIAIHIDEPGYSEQARKARLSGSVLVYAEIDREGRPRNLRISRSMGLGLDEKAMESVARWLFRPGTKDGKPVTVRATFEVNFRLL